MIDEYTLNLRLGGWRSQPSVNVPSPEYGFNGEENFSFVTQYSIFKPIRTAFHKRREVPMGHQCVLWLRFALRFWTFSYLGAGGKKKEENKRL